jgi:hypothetical protein
MLTGLKLSSCFTISIQAVWSKQQENLCLLSALGWHLAWYTRQPQRLRQHVPLKCQLNFSRLCNIILKRYKLFSLKIMFRVHTYIVWQLNSGMAPWKRNLLTCALGAAVTYEILSLWSSALCEMVVSLLETVFKICKIWGFHSSDYEECHLLGWNTMWLL